MGRETDAILADFPSVFLPQRVLPLRQHPTPQIARIASAVLGRQGQTWGARQAIGNRGEVRACGQRGEVGPAVPVTARARPGPVRMRRRRGERAAASRPGGPSWSARATGAGRPLCAPRPLVTALGSAPCLAVP